MVIVPLASLIAVNEFGIVVFTTGRTYVLGKGHWKRKKKVLVVYRKKADYSGMTVATLGYTMVICGNSDDPHHRYRGRIEKVKFGVPIEEAFAHDIPATLLVLLLKVHKDGPAKKDIWRAPGNQAQVRKLSHIMQHGRLVNIANFSVYTAASVIKKFLSKLPGGIFGLENEHKLFDLYNISSDLELQRQSFCRVLSSLPIPSQHLLVLLFGTFYMISESADSFGSRMTAEALGISVAPSLFHSCIHDGQRAKIEDVIRFKIASEIISRIIENFGFTSLFPQECYQFYARITGRTLRFNGNDSRLRFVTPANVHEWPVPPPSTYSIMAARCAGSYSMGTVAAIDHINSNYGRHFDHYQQQHHHPNIIQTVSAWTVNRNNCIGGEGGTRKVSCDGDIRILDRPIDRQYLSVDTSMDNNELESGLLTFTTNLQPHQRTSSYPYATVSHYRRTFFGAGSHHITVANIVDDELTSKKEKPVLRSSNSQITATFLSEHESMLNYPRNSQVLSVSDMELYALGSCDF
uniref:Rho-GAP domain-containing protein n=1 Tax=Setaria digitata TaxID=48799 RepID=A0A915Q5C6_9BILA